MKKRVRLLTALTLLCGTILAACSGNSNGGETAPNGNDAAAGSKGTGFSILIGKPEIVEQFEQVTQEYSKEKNVDITIIPLGSQLAYEKLSTLYASNNAPTLMMLGQEFPEMKSKLADLSDQPWVSHAMEGTLDFVTDGSKVLGMPATVEAFGFIYNKTVLDKAVGGTFDPATVKTRDDLKALFDKVKASGVEALHVSPMDWSLGAHLSNIMFTTQSAKPEERRAFMDSLKTGQTDLSANAIFNGWVDTFDLMKEYNSAKSAPLAPTYDDGTLALASGEVGLWFMGNWAYPQLKEANPDAEYGFLPVPISNNPEDYGNSQISVGVPQYWAIDASSSTPEQQQAAKDFLNWLVSDPKGQDAYVNKFNYVPVYDNFAVKPQDMISQSLMKFMDNGQTLEWMNNLYPVDGWPKMGAIMQKYLADTIDRAGLAKEFADYWKSVK